MTANEVLKKIRKGYSENFGDPTNPKDKLLFDDSNKEVIEKLCRYFANDPIFETLGKGYSLGKGILLQGDVGCGKTLLMRLLRNNQKYSFKVVSCDDIASDFSQNGEMALAQHIERSHKNVKMLQGYCYDDLGTEEKKSHFGNQMEVMTRILSKRYFAGKPFFTTHLTTNLDAEGIEDKYGIRLRDRFREMFNPIQFPNSSQSRRK